MSHSNPDSTLYCQVVDNKGSTGIAHIAHTFAPASRRCVLYRGVLSCKLPLYGYNEFPFILLKIKVVLLRETGVQGVPPCLGALPARPSRRPSSYIFYIYN